jgi:uncharacterized protein (TIGR04255 family)
MPPTNTAEPEFEKPPIVEVALGVQFSPLSALRTVHLGLLWSMFRKDFPRTEDQPPLARAIERFDKPDLPLFRIEPAPLTPRSWFLSKDGSELVQVQQDRFVHNWRKMGSNTAYPRYRNLREKFAENLRTFESFAKAEQLGEFKPDQCELTYVDHIESGEVWKDFTQVDAVIRSWQPPKTDVKELVHENVTLEINHLILGKDGKPRGRLHIRVAPVYRMSDHAPILSLEFLARGAPLAPGINGILGFLDLAHDCTLGVFTTMTTTAIQKSWRLKNG